jgi:hypothetical protein
MIHTVLMSMVWVFTLFWCSGCDEGKSPRNATEMIYSGSDSGSDPSLDSMDYSPQTGAEDRSLGGGMNENVLGGEQVGGEQVGGEQVGGELAGGASMGGETQPPLIPDSSPSTGFSPSITRWQVPDLGTDDGVFSAWYQQSPWWYSTLDLNGDGVTDFIQSANDQGNVWQDDQGSYWKVWLGQTSGFSSDFIRWSVPESGLEDGFFSLNWSDGRRWFSTRDLNGDGYSDLIQSADQGRDGGHVWRDVQGTYWKVWLGNDRGFTDEITRWSVPESGLDDGFFCFKLGLW